MELKHLKTFEQFDSYNQEDSLNEGLVSKFEKLSKDDKDEIEKLFNKAFRNILNNKQYGRIKRIADKTSTEKKYELLEQASKEKKPFKGSLRANKSGELVYITSQQADKYKKSPFASGGTGGATSGGGVSGTGGSMKVKKDKKDDKDNKDKEK